MRADFTYVLRNSEVWLPMHNYEVFHGEHFDYNLAGPKAFRAGIQWHQIHIEQLIGSQLRASQSKERSLNTWSRQQNKNKWGNLGFKSEGYVYFKK